MDGVWRSEQKVAEMKIYKTQAKVEADIVDGKLVVNDHVTFKCSIKINASISALDISALDISARNICSQDISAWDISARDISAWDISFWAVCYARIKFVCKSIKGRRDNSKYFCLDSAVVIKGDSQ